MAGSRELTKRQALTEVTKKILRLKGDAAKSIYQIGRLLDEVQRTEQWRDGGHASFAIYAKKEADMSHRVAQRFIRVALNFNAAIAERYGVTKLDAALKYLSATQASEKPGDLVATEIRVRGPEGRYHMLSLHEATAVQIEDATKLLKQGKAGLRGAPKRMRARTDRLAEALRPLAPTAGKTAPVRLVRDRDGRYRVSFKAIDYEQLAEFAAIVSRLANEEDD